MSFNFGERHYYQFLAALKNRIERLAAIITENNIDLVHSSTLSVADGAFAARFAHVPHIWHIHGKSIGTTNSYGVYISVKTLYSLAASLSDCIAAVSNDVDRFLQQYIKCEPPCVVYNGMDINEFDALASLPTSLREEFQLNDKKLVMLVGRLEEVKGIEDYVQSAIKVLSKRNDAAFIIAGRYEDKELSERIRSFVSAKGLANSIVFTGARNDIPAMLRESDIFVCSSKTEGFSYAVLEAMAAAKPVVTTRCGGPEEMVIHKETGLHVDVGMPEQIAEALHMLLDNKQMREDMGRKGRKTAEQKFNAEIYARNFEDIYMRFSCKRERKAPNPWGEVMLGMASNIGDLGMRIRHLEHEVRDLRSFESIFKDNCIYQGLKNLRKIFKK